MQYTGQPVHVYTFAAGVVNIRKFASLKEAFRELDQRFTENVNTEIDSELIKVWRNEEDRRNGIPPVAEIRPESTE